MLAYCYLYSVHAPRPPHRLPLQGGVTSASTFRRTFGRSVTAKQVSESQAGISPKWLGEHPPLPPLLVAVQSIPTGPMRRQSLLLLKASTHPPCAEPFWWVPLSRMPRACQLRPCLPRIAGTHAHTLPNATELSCQRRAFSTCSRSSSCQHKSPRTPHCAMECIHEASLFLHSRTAAHLSPRTSRSAATPLCCQWRPFSGHAAAHNLTRISHHAAAPILVIQQLLQSQHTEAYNFTRISHRAAAPILVIQQLLQSLTAYRSLQPHTHLTLRRSAHPGDTAIAPVTHGIQKLTTSHASHTTPQRPSW